MNAGVFYFLGIWILVGSFGTDLQTYPWHYEDGWRFSFVQSHGSFCYPSSKLELRITVATAIYTLVEQTLPPASLHFYHYFMFAWFIHHHRLLLSYKAAKYRNRTRFIKPSIWKPIVSFHGTVNPTDSDKIELTTIIILVLWKQKI